MNAPKKLTAQDIIERRRAQAEAARKPSLHNTEAPAGYSLRGVSTLLGKDGEVKQTWVKTARDAVDPSSLLDEFQLAIAERDIPAAPLVPSPKPRSDDLLAVYPMGDPHIGMLSWHLETGEDFDLHIAESNLVGAVDRLVSLAPDCKTALIVNVGDFFHSDNQSNKTSRSGHSLDVDSRWAKVLRVGIRAMTRCIDRALEKHERVHVINEIGNHDDHSAIMLAVCLDHHYRENPRVHIDTSPSKFHWFEFGACLFGVTHGDTVKPQDLPAIMAADQASAWGRTKFRHWITGHLHHEIKKEYVGCTVETHRTLAGRDAWHHGQGYRAGRSMVCDVYHREYGFVLRHQVGVEALGGKYV